MRNLEIASSFRRKAESRFDKTRLIPDAHFRGFAINSSLEASR
jgi:hypothetical protein